MPDPVLRYDRGQLRSRKRTEQGFLRVDGVATRAGVFHYRNADGTVRREYRPAAEVAKADCLRSLEGCPVTDGHPDGLVTPENARELARGFTGYGVRMDGDLVIVPDITITDADLIDKIEAGKAELSCGYLVDLDETPGETPAGERYDAVQTNIRNNHLAVVERARAGPVARLHLDAAEQVEAPQPTHRDTEEPRTMLINVHGTQIEVPDGAGAIITAALRADAGTIQALTGQVEAVRGEVTTEKTRADGLQGQLDQAKTELGKRNDAATVAPLVAARIKLEREAGAVLPTETKLDGLTDRQVMETVIKAADPDVKLDGQSDAYVAGRYDGALTSLTRVDSTGALNAVTRAGTVKKDAGEEARDEMLKRQQGAWQACAAK